ncbi:MAG: ABC transporter substrate-binding protein [Rubrivivax sp.]
MTSTKLLLSLGLASLMAATTGQAFADPVTLQMWTNATNDPLKGIFQGAADAYHAAHPDVTIQITPIQNEFDRPARSTLALGSDNPPDIYFNQGAALLATQAQSGKVADITDATKNWIGDIGAAANNWAVDGKQYGIPYTMHVVGFWYRKDLFAKAGIAAPPTTMNDLQDAIAKLKAKGHRADRRGRQGPLAGCVLLRHLRAAPVRRRYDARRPGRRAAQGPVLDRCRADAARLPQVRAVPGWLQRHLGPAGSGQLRRHGRQRQGRHGAEGTWNMGVMQSLNDDKELRRSDRLVPLPGRRRRQG